jgi:hypothetical protein
VRSFGLSADGLRQSTVAASVILAAGIALCLIVGLARGSVGIGSHMLILALLYPVWGLVQQLLVQAMFVRNLVPVLPVPLVVAFASVLFGSVHLPDYRLAIATAILGGLFTPVFIRWRNVWALGVCHGLLGVFFYFWVLGSDPWLKMFPASQVAAAAHAHARASEAQAARRPARPNWTRHLTQVSRARLSRLTTVKRLQI